MLFGDIAVHYKNGKFSRATKSLTEGTEGSMELRTLNRGEGQASCSRFTHQGWAPLIHLI